MCCLILCSYSNLIWQLSRPIVGSDESCDGAVKLVDSWEFLYVLFNKLDGGSYWLWLRLRTKKGLQGGKTIQQRSEIFASLVPNASTSSLAHALVRSLHTCMCVYYSESTQLSVQWHTAAPSPELGPMTQTDLSASMWLHINIAIRTNK